MTPIAESSASFTYGGLTGPKAKLDFGTPIDGVIKSIDGEYCTAYRNLSYRTFADKSANIYVHFMYEGSEDLLKQLDNELAKLEKSDLLIPYDTGSGTADYGSPNPNILFRQTDTVSNQAGTDPSVY